MIRRRTVLLLAGGVLLAVIGLAGYPFYRLAGIGSAFVAKTLCSQVFVGGRRADEVAESDLPAYRSAALRWVDWHLDADRGTVSADLLGLGRRQAIHRPGLGCTLVFDRPPVPVAPPPLATTPEVFPPTSATPPSVERLVAAAFAEPDPERPRRTRALLVVHRGRTVAERYAPGYSAQSVFPGWSISKSVINALVGIQVAQGRLHPDAPAPVAEWDGDARRAITLGQMLHMSTGLEFDEDYHDPLADVVWILYGSGDGAAFAAAKPLTHPPGTHFSYSTGTTAIVSRLVATAAGEGYAAFARRHLFGPLGMDSAIIEPDAAGTPVGASHVWANARDWARFGLLYLADGVWQGQRILPESWVRYSRTPAPAAPEAQYGAHFWLRPPLPFRTGRDLKSSLPRDTFHAIGHGGQFITVVPSRQLVVVRLGLALDPGAWDHEGFMHDLLAALPAAEREARAD